MTEIMICICTYMRPAGLQRVLAAVDEIELRTLTDDRIAVGIVDNDQAGGAKKVCDAYRKTGRFVLQYVNEKRKGLAMARNAALQAAREADALYAAFIDDDEAPEPQWLEELYTRVQKGDVGAVAGPTSPIFAAHPPRWLPTTAYATLRKPANGYISEGGGGNCMFDLRKIDEFGLSFSEKFNETGGEDTYLFHQLNDKGMRIAWAEKAVVLEDVPLSRMTRAWLWRRWYRIGSTECAIAKIDNHSTFTRLKFFGKGLARVLLGSLKVLLAAPLLATGRPDRVTDSFYTLCRGCGMLVCVVGGTGYVEYSKPTIERT